MTMLDTPIRVDYAFTAGEAQSRFLRGLANGKFLGQRSRSATRSTYRHAVLAPLTA